jgi:transposase
VVYEACGFGFTLYRQLIAAGAHCYVIAPRKLDDEGTRVKTDPRDCNHAVSAFVALSGRQHSRAGGDSKLFPFTVSSNFGIAETP